MTTTAKTTTTTTATTPAIELRDVTMRFGDRAVLAHVDLQIAAGRTTVVLGPSGTGKSTVLRLASGLLAPTEGRVVTLGVDVQRASRRELQQLRQRIGVLFQDNALFGSLSVFDNVAFPLRRVAKKPEVEVRRRVHELLDLVGLPDVGDRMPDQLSGGQRKRIALARALALEPELVLFDEPTSGLDPQTSASIDRLITSTQRRLGSTFVVITHDVESCRLIADDIGLLREGRVHLFGPRAVVDGSRDPAVRAFLDRHPTP